MDQVEGWLNEGGRDKRSHESKTYTKLWKPLVQLSEELTFTVFCFHSKVQMSELRREKPSEKAPIHGDDDGTVLVGK